MITPHFRSPTVKDRDMRAARALVLHLRCDEDVARQVVDRLIDEQRDALTRWDNCFAEPGEGAEQINAYIQADIQAILRNEQRPAPPAVYFQHVAVRTQPRGVTTIADVRKIMRDQAEYYAAERVAERVNAHFSRLTSRAFDRTYYEEHKAEGLDYAAYGPWQRDYAVWLRDSFQLAGRTLLDVGTACGAIAHGFTMAGVHATGIDVSESMITIGRRRQQYEGSRAAWPFADDGQPTRLEICDAANLHLFADEAFDFIHSHQSAEHWPAELVPRILRELARVARPASRFFCVLDTCELATRTGRDLAAEDPTHVCIRPLAWWHEQLALAGWRVTTEAHRPTLIEHPLCYFGRPGLDWDWWAAEKLS